MPKHRLHVSLGSAPCRATLLLLRQLDGLDVEVVPLDLSENEHLTPEFLAINPRHCVPTLETPYGALTESRAIMMYLAELAGMGAEGATPWFPRRIWARAKVTEWLDWDQGSFYPAIGEIVYPQVFGDVEEPSMEALTGLDGVLRHLNDSLADREYLVGASPTVADLSIAAGITMLELVGLEVDDVPHIDRWLSRVQELSGWSEVDAPFQGWVQSVQAKRTANGKDPDAATHESPGETESEPEARAAQG
jgi:glutathione S-transferase